MPIANFVTRTPAPKVGLINRVNGQRVVTVTANVAEGAQSALVQQQVLDALKSADLGERRHLQDEGRGRGARTRPAPS